MIKVTIPEEGTRGTFVLWMNNIASINYFLATPLEADGVNNGRERKTKAIPEHPRRRGPSDQTPVTVSASSADYMFDPTLKSGNALPGFSIRVTEAKKQDGTQESRQMTLVGRTVDFEEYFDDLFKNQTFVHYSIGGRHTFQPAAGGGD